MRRHAGFSLVELMIALVIIAIVMSVAVPSYRQFVYDGNRQAAQAFMLVLAESQERYFSENKFYADALTDLGYATATVDIDSGSQVVSSGSSDAIYRMSFTNVATADYTIQAAPLNGQADDTDCGTLTMSMDGTRTASGNGSDCW